MNFLLNQVNSVDDNFKSINFGIIFNDEFSAVRPRNFRYVLELKKTVVCVVNNE